MTHKVHDLDLQKANSVNDRHIFLHNILVYEQLFDLYLLISENKFNAYFYA